MKKSDYHKIIDRITRPKLLELGFTEVKLKDCMKPEVLYQNGSLWFGTSWDWRDRYLEIDLGHLHWFKDVMPRFIVLGNYASYSNTPYRFKETDENFLEKVASSIAETLQNAIDIYNQRYDEIKTNHLKKRNKFSAVFAEHLGPEVTENELSAYKA